MLERKESRGKSQFPKSNLSVRLSFLQRKEAFWQRKGKGDSKSSRIFFVDLPGGEGGRFVSRRSICRDGFADLTGAWCCGLCAYTTCDGSGASPNTETS